MVHLMKAGVTQGSILSPILYSVYTAEIPTLPDNVLHTFADSECFLAPHEDPKQASSHLQGHLNLLQSWFRWWRIKVNAATRHQITFSLRRATCLSVQLNQTPLPVADEAATLGSI